MTQLFINLPAAAPSDEDGKCRLAGGKDWLLERDWLTRACAVIGHKAVCFELDIAGSTLSALLAETETEADSSKGTDKRKRRFPAEYRAVIVRMAPRSMQLEWLQLQARQLGFVVTEPRTMTHEEELAARRAFAASYAPGVLAAEDEHIAQLRGGR